MGGRISFENTSSAIFSLLRLTGNYGDCLPEITTATAADEDDEVGVDEGAYPTPNVTLHKSYTTTAVSYTHLDVYKRQLAPITAISAVGHA